MSGLYVHIPFCASRCIYCGFYSTTQAVLRLRYVDAVCREMDLRQEEFNTLAPIKTIYFGGGTPSQLSISQLEQLFHSIAATMKGQSDFADMEITLEANPDDVTEEFARDLRRLPVNRVSLGAQTFSDARLQFIHRRHTSAQVGMAVERLRKAGIQNISIDLMFGFPEETLSDWEKDVEAAISLQTEHISAYALTYEEGTPLYRLQQAGKVQPLGEETLRAMYFLMKERLEAAGYEHYEISNFARRRSQHNSGYWQACPYIGLGAAAHSYSGTTRSWNVSDLQQYITSIEQGRRPHETETLDAPTRYNDLIVTALRTREGIPFALLDAKQRQYLLQQAAPMIERGLLQATADHLHLTAEGLFISDNIMVDLLL